MGSRFPRSLHPEMHSKLMRNSNFTLWYQNSSPQWNINGFKPLFRRELPFKTSSIIPKEQSWALATTDSRITKWQWSIKHCCCAALSPFIVHSVIICLACHRCQGCRVVVSTMLKSVACPTLLDLCWAFFSHPTVFFGGPYSAVKHDLN